MKTYICRITICFQKQTSKTLLIVDFFPSSLSIKCFFNYHLDVTYGQFYTGGWNLHEYAEALSDYCFLYCFPFNLPAFRFPVLVTA